MRRQITAKEYNEFFEFFDDRKDYTKIGRTNPETAPINSSKFSDIEYKSINGFEELNNLQIILKEDTWYYLTVYFGYRGRLVVIKHYLIDNIFDKPFWRTKIKSIELCINKLPSLLCYTGHSKGQIFKGSYFSKLLAFLLESEDFYV